MDRKVMISVFVGIFTAGFTNMLIIVFLSQFLFPIDLPEGFADFSKEAKYNFALNLPLVNFLAEIFAQGVGVLIGIMVGRLLYRQSVMPLYIITVIMMMMGVLTFISRPHPGWFVVADLAFTGLLAYTYIRTKKKA